MRKTTMIVAFLAASVASAGAAPADGKSTARVLSRQTSSATEASKVPFRQTNVRNGDWVSPDRLNPGKAAREAAAAGPRKTPQTVAAAPRADAPKAKRARIARLGVKRVAPRRLARRSAGGAQAVALRREIESPSVTGALGGGGSIPSMVSRMAQAHGVSPALAHAVVKVESRYQPRATGPGGYIGLMQLSYQTARGMGFRGSRQALYEPGANLTYGMKYLAGAVRKSGGNTCAAVSKYQGGHGVRGVTRAGAVYCAKVKRFMAEGIPASGRTVADAAAK